MTHSDDRAPRPRWVPLALTGLLLLNLMSAIVDGGRWTWLVVALLALALALNLWRRSRTNQ